MTAEDYGWQSFWWLSTAFSTFTNLWILLFLPETKWDRRAIVTPLSDPAATGYIGELPSKDDTMVTKTEQVDQIEHAPVSVAADTLDERVLGRPSKTQMLPIVGWKVHEPILGAIILPLKLVRFPIVLWGALQFTFACSCFLMLNLTQSQALAVAPYNFTPAEVGYTNLALFVGTCFSLATAGPFSDWVSQRATVRNNGIREPEMRLPALLPFALCNLVGCVVASLGFQYGWPWEAVIVVGFGFVGIQVAAISGISINYVVRSTLCRSCIFTSLTVSLD